MIGLSVRINRMRTQSGGYKGADKGANESPTSRRLLLQQATEPISNEPPATSPYSFAYHDPIELENFCCLLFVYYPL